MTGLVRLESFPFDSRFDGYDDDGYPVYDRAVGASMLRSIYNRFFSNGVFPSPPDGLQLSKGDGLTITVQPGIAIINGGIGGVVGSRATLVLDEAPPQGKTAYAIFARSDINEEARSLYLRVAKGEPGTTPKIPTPEDLPGICEIRIGYVVVPSGATDLSEAEVVNEKGTEACPFAAPFATVDLSGVVNEVRKGAQQALDDLKDAVSSDLGLLESALDGSTAGHLQTQINALKSGGAVSSDGLADGAVTARKMASGAVGTNNVKDDAITSAKLAPEAVTLGKIADGAVDTRNVVPGAITADKVSPEGFGSALGMYQGTSFPLYDGMKQLQFYNVSISTDSKEIVTFARKDGTFMSLALGTESSYSHKYAVKGTLANGVAVNANTSVDHKISSGSSIGSTTPHLMCYRMKDNVDGSWTAQLYLYYYYNAIVAHGSVTVDVSAEGALTVKYNGDTNAVFEEQAFAENVGGSFRLDDGTSASFCPSRRSDVKGSRVYRITDDGAVTFESFSTSGGSNSQYLNYVVCDGRKLSYYYTFNSRTITVIDLLNGCEPQTYDVASTSVSYFGAVLNDASKRIITANSVGRFGKKTLGVVSLNEDSNTVTTDVIDSLESPYELADGFIAMQEEDGSFSLCNPTKKLMASSKAGFVRFDALSSAPSGGETGIIEKCDEGLYLMSRKSHTDSSYATMVLV